jgi:hypothetical protein
MPYGIQIVEGGADRISAWQEIEDGNEEKVKENRNLIGKMSAFSPYNRAYCEALGCSLKYCR